MSTDSYHTVPLSGAWTLFGILCNGLYPSSLASELENSRHLRRLFLYVVASLEVNITVSLATTKYTKIRSNCMTLSAGHLEINHLMSCFFFGAYSYFDVRLR